MIAIFLSILFPGLGQLYYGKTGKGLLMIALCFLPFIYPLVLIWSIYDCIQLRKTEKVDAITRKQAITALLIGFVIIPLLTVVFIGGAIHSSTYISNTIFKASNTEKEMREISVQLDKYKQKNNTYPENLVAIVGRSPIRQTYLTDSWGNLYRYKKTSENSFIITSAGLDNTFDTVDDLQLNP